MATSLGISRHDLKVKHRLMVNLANDLEKRFLTVRTQLTRFADAFYESERHFPWTRIKKLHELVEAATSETVLSHLQQCIQDSNLTSGGVTEQPKSSIHDLMVKMDAIDALQHGKKDLPTSPEKGQGDGEKRPLITGKGLYGKGRQFVRKVQKLSGFYDEPIEDEDVMTNERLLFCMRTRERRIALLHNEFTKTHAALNKLLADYQSVRTQCCCWRYFNLLTIIQHAVEETGAETHFEP